MYKRQALKALEKQLKAAEQSLDSDLDEIDVAVKTTGGSVYTTNDVYTALIEYQSAVRSAMSGAAGNLRAAFQNATSILVDAGVALEDYPTGFRYGDGGTSDDFLHQLWKDIDHSLRKAEKRTRKTGKVFEKKLGVRLSIRLDRPSNFPEYGGADPSQFGQFEHTVAIALAARKLDSPGQGLLYLWGGDGNASALHLTYAYQSSVTFQPVASLSSGWGVSIFGLAAGHYELRIAFIGKNRGGGYAGISVP